MKRLFFALICATMMLYGCGAMDSDPGAGITIGSPVVTGGGSANAFNPYMQKNLPNTRVQSEESQEMLNSFGGSIPSIETEAAHRQYWRQEIYPIVFGERTAPHEIIVLLDFARPDSEKVWAQVVQAAKSLSPAQCKIVVYGHSGENYGSDLMGLAIWIAHQRQGQAMQYLTYALARWNEVKAAQRRAGAVKKFTNEYDATATAQEYPIHYAYFSRLKPPLPATEELPVANYCYDAGNVNMYQCVQVCNYYGVKQLPAVIVNGHVLKQVTAANILATLK